VTTTEVNAIEVRLENLSLVEAAFHTQREQRLFDFPIEIPLGRQCYMPNQLLGDCAAALFHCACLQVDPCGTREADDVHSGVSEEVAVLRS
jgi:hypothetical protein